MQELSLKPSEVMTGDTVIHNIEKLNEYYQRLKSGEQILPIFVVDPYSYTIENFRYDLEKIKKNYTPLEFRIMDFNSAKLGEDLICKTKRGVKYLLCDGNHRSIAYALAGLEISAKQVENFRDIRAIIREFGTQTLSVMYNSESMRHFMFSLFRGLCRTNYRSLTIEDKVSVLRSSNELKLENGIITYQPNCPF